MSDLVRVPPSNLVALPITNHLTMLRLMVKLNLPLNAALMASLVAIGLKTNRNLWIERWQGVDFPMVGSKSEKKEPKKCNKILRKKRWVKAKRSKNLQEGISSEALSKIFY